MGEGASLSQVAAEIAKATVVIHTVGTNGSDSIGSGFIVESTGTVVTNYHVVVGASRIEIKTAAGDSFEVIGIRASDPRRDIAILQVPAFHLPIVRLGDSSTMQVGDRVIVIGTALGLLDNSVTSGIVSGLRDREGTRLFQMDAAVSPGNSGGPVANQDGEIIGITVAKLTGGESLNFAIPINYARGMFQLPVQQGLGALAESSAPSLLSTPARGYPPKWRSLMSGTNRTVRVDGDYIYVEVELPSEAVAAGAFTIGEAKREGDKWAGRFHIQGVCVPRMCPAQEMPLEITLLTPSRIEGVTSMAPDGSFNCRKCAYSKPPIPTKFVWIPAQ